MKISRFVLPALLACVLTAGAATAEDLVRSTEQWRQERVDRLTAPEGWLSLIGLHWLQPGDNTVGSAAGNSLRLAAGPARFGTVHLGENGSVRFDPADDAIAVDGRPEKSAELQYDNGSPTIVRGGTVSFFVIRREDKVGLRVRDSESPRRTGFAGIDYFDIAPAWRIEAQWVPFDTPRRIPITNALGQTMPQPCPGKAVFTHEGRTVELLPIAEGPGDLFFIIADATTGRETYGGGRFLYASPPVDGVIVLDFNRAQNPPCAFTPFATCPLPPKENRLPFAVDAGEKEYRGAHR